MKKRSFPLLFVCLIVFLFSCTKSSPSLNNNTNTINTSNSTTLSLAGTKWTLYQYKDATMQNPLNRNDTLVFIDAGNYKYNNVSCTYDLVHSPSSYSTMLRLYGTPFGDIGGSVSTNFTTYGEIVDAPFNQITVTPGATYYIWMKKI
ncbi:MAG TPA: hypothetical protein VNX01_06340 [Bacteroidia bacterium]|nr:hypothetical protein [Bacteroidia bacterium]